jgi:nicotinamide-nucleotide amidase
MLSLSAEVGKQLKLKGVYLATAESCTGGGIAQIITEIAGSSAWFERGFITYSNASKQELLDVPAHILNNFGAVSEQTVLAMAKGALAHSSAHISVAVSGIAGPDGGTVEKPIGTVWIAWAMRERAIARCFQFEGDRYAIRQQTIEQALQGIVIQLQAMS